MSKRIEDVQLDENTGNVVAKMKVTQTPDEYFRRVSEFANGITHRFIDAGTESGTLMGADKTIPVTAKMVGKDPDDFSGQAIDVKFSALSAGLVVVNVLSLMPPGMRGELLGEVIDLLVVNSALSDDRLIAVLQKNLLQVGDPTNIVERKGYSF